MLLPYLDKYPEEFIPKEYFFEWEAGKEYSESSVQNIAHAAEKAAGRKKKTSLHILRHTYATQIGKWCRFKVYSKYEGTYKQ